jgi:hypothetical protein
MTYRGRMIAFDCLHARLARGVTLAALLALGPVLGACAGMSDNMSTAFADPAKYDLYDCKQLEAERKALASRGAELQGLMSKAETGTGGVVVAEIAYRNDYVAVRGQSQFADEAWRRNKCQETPPPPATPVKPGTGKNAAVKPAKPAARPAMPGTPGAPVSTLPRDGSTY